MDRREAELFVGRSTELSRLADLFGSDPPAPVAFVHGPGGIGKSALCRRVSSLARERGYRIEWVDGRSAGAIDRIRSIADHLGEERILLVVDTYEAIQGIDGDLRSRLPARPSGPWRMLVAGRRPPSPHWREGQWKGTAVVHLDALARSESVLYLEKRGLAADDSLVDWAAGEPLALAVAADTLALGGDFAHGSPEFDEVIARTLMERLAGREAERREVLSAAAVARAVDTPALEVLLRGCDPAEAEAWLRGLSFTEDLDGRVAVHARLRQAISTLTRREDPAHHRELRRRLADHLYSRARSGERSAVSEMAELVEDPRLRWGLGVEQAATHHADRIRPGDEEVVRTQVEPAQPRRWALLSRWFRESPQHVVVVRDRDGELTGVGVYLTCDDAPTWADEDPVLAKWLPHARSMGGRSLISRGGVAVRWVPDRAALGNSLMLGRWEHEWQRIYAAGYPGSSPQRSFLQTMGYHRVPDLDVEEGEQEVHAQVLDLDRGVAGHMHHLVYRDLGLSSIGPPDMVAEVHHLLRCFHDPTALAATPLARGGTVTERAGSVSELLRAALEAAFGDTADEVLMRRILEHGYMEAGTGHEETARVLHLGRSTYFRRLGRAVERMAVYLDSTS